MQTSDVNSDSILHYIFVYCAKHDQGSVAIITSSELKDLRNIFNYVSNMCGGLEIKCNEYWNIRGYLEFNQQTNQLSGVDRIQTNFDKEGGGWKFAYFQYELYNSQGHIEKNELPYVVREFLSHLDSPIHKIKLD